MKHKVDLNPNYLTIVKKILDRHLPTHAKVWIFGSRTKGGVKKFSDIDLLIDIGAPISIELLTKLALDFEESNLPYKVDIADAASISKQFHDNIQEQLILIR